MPVILKNLSYIIDAMVTSMNPTAREEMFERLKPDGAFTDRNTILLMMEQNRIAQMQREDLGPDDLERLVVQTMAVTSVITRLNEHASAWREGAWEEKFAPQPESDTVNFSPI